MKITALLVLKAAPEATDPVILANASDVSHFGYFQRSSVKEFVVFVGRTVASRTPPSQRQSVQHEEYKVHAYNRNGLCAVGFMDDHYPVRSAFSLLNQVIDEYQKSFGETWRSAKEDSSQPWPYLAEALTKFQDPAEADKLLNENNRVMEISSSDVSSPLSYQFNGNGKIPTDTNSKGSNNQLLERQKAHVQQFLGTEDALNKAAEARVLCQKLKNRLHGNADAVSSHSLGGGTSQNVKNLRQLELDVWGKEREAAGLRASLNTLISEIQRLNKLSAERKEAEHSLKQKWKKIEEFDARRSELETIYTTLLKANMDAAAFWSQQPLAAREYAMATIIPASEVVADFSKNAKDFIEKEVSAFFQSPDNTLYMLPATPQALLESMGANGSTGPEAVASAEKNAALLTARAGARDPSAIPSICRISAALQYPAGVEGSDASLASVLESLEFCLRLRGSEACVLEDLAKAINLVDIRQDLVESGRALLSHAYHAQQEYERTTKHCLDLATEQDNTITEKWLPELKTAVLDAQASLEHCKHVWGLLDEWYEQPAATVVDWVTVDGQNVAAWHNHVKSSYCLLR